MGGGGGGVFELGNPEGKGGSSSFGNPGGSGGQKNRAFRRGGVDFFWNNPLILVTYLFTCSVTYKGLNMYSMIQSSLLLRQLTFHVQIP